MLDLQPDSDRTSFAAQVPVPLDRRLNTAKCTLEPEQSIVVAYGEVRAANVLPRKVQPSLSVQTELFKTNVIINSPPLTSVFMLTGNRIHCLVWGLATEPAQQTIEFRALLEGPSKESSTTDQWELATAIESEIDAGLSDLRRIVSAIRQARPLTSAPDFDALLMRAAQAHGTPENIEEWARQLAEDISDLTD